MFFKKTFEADFEVKVSINTRGRILSISKTQHIYLGRAQSRSTDINRKRSLLYSPLFFTSNPHFSKKRVEEYRGSKKVIFTDEID